MTALEFRSSTERATLFRELLSNPTFAAAIVVLKDEKPSAAVPPGSDATDVARALGRLEQHDNDIDLLLSLAEPLPEQPKEEEATFGVDRSKFFQEPTR